MVQKSYDAYLQMDEQSETSDQKVALLEEAFKVHFGDNLINSEAGKADSKFPAVYALDFIQFGLKRKIPAAIRLGELILAEHCDSHDQALMPRELAMAVKDFMFEH